MTDSNRELRSTRPPPLPPSARVLPLPALPVEPGGPALDYYRPAMQAGTPQWVTLARFPTTARWHQARAAMSRGKIESLMGEGEDVASDASEFLWTDGIALKVPESELPRAIIILQAVRDGKEWCPRCGLVNLEALRLPWWWMIWSVLFLGVAPFSPPRFQCSNCGHRWE
jgi:hypothetical protein